GENGHNRQRYRVRGVYDNEVCACGCKAGKCVRNCVYWDAGASCLRNVAKIKKIPKGDKRL
ncbi:MAG: hypothetical protein RSB90_10940, partial [Eubacterium sp.]